MPQSLGESLIIPGMNKRLLDEELTRSVIGAFFKVYNRLRFGFLEESYAKALTIELRKRAHKVEREKSVTVFYEGEPLSTQRLDMIVDDRLVIEIKSTKVLSPHSIRQLHNYLRATDLEVGLLLHFGPKAKFYRVIVTNDRKNLITDPTDLADLTDQETIGDCFVVDQLDPLNLSDPLSGC